MSLTHKERHAPSIQVQMERSKYQTYLETKKSQRHREGKQKSLYRPLGEVVNDMEMKGTAIKGNFISRGMSKLNKAFSSMGHRRKV